MEYERGSSDRLLRAFYALLRLTRRRHGLPPQPFAWFRNLVACLRRPASVTIHVASHDGRPIASILTLTFRKTVVYKYGGSDAAYHRLYGMPFLFWRAIQAAKAEGCEQLDLGRSDLDQPGLAVFKEHLGAARSTLTYYTFPPRTACPGARRPVHSRGPPGRPAPARCGPGPRRPAALPAPWVAALGEPVRDSTVGARCQGRLASRPDTRADSETTGLNLINGSNHVE